MFSVTSESGDTTYKVYFVSTETHTAPWCDCIDWARIHLPCKHVLAVITNFQQWGWDKLPAEYTSFPLFTLDPQLMSDVHQTCRLSDMNMESVVQNEPQLSVQNVTEESSARDPASTTVTTSSTDALNLQRHIRLSLSELSSLTYRVSDDVCLKQAVKTLLPILNEMRKHVHNISSTGESQTRVTDTSLCQPAVLYVHGFRYCGERDGDEDCVGSSVARH